MLPSPSDPTARRPGIWPLFSFRGIRVFLHWSWILVAVYFINDGRGLYSNIAWDIAQYVTLFLIVLLHEFGHAFATRQVGGTADQILLWPFGGIAYVQTPPRPKAYLWGIAAGPLVNVALLPVLYGIGALAGYCVKTGAITDITLAFDLLNFSEIIFLINLYMLIFNLIPLFPMDGGQMLRGLLWFKYGSVRSLEIAAIVALPVGAGGIIWALVYRESLWMASILGLMVLQAWNTLQAIRRARRERVIV